MGDASYEQKQAHRNADSVDPGLIRVRSTTESGRTLPKFQTGSNVFAPASAPISPLDRVWTRAAFNGWRTGWQSGVWERGFVLLILIALIFSGSGCSQKEDSIPLPDGRKLQVCSTSYGTRHVAPGQTMRRLEKLLPKPLQKGLRFVVPDAAQPVSEVRTAETNLVVWMRFVGKTKSTNSSFDRLVLFASMQGRSQPSGVLSWPEPFQPWHRMPHFTFDQFPRDRRTLRFEIERELPWGFEADRMLPAGVLQFPNPSGGSGPKWNPESLPAVRETNGIRAVLTAFTVEEERSIQTNRAPRVRRRLNATIHLEDAERRVLSPIEFTVSDAGGNTLKGFPFPEALDTNGTWRLQFPGALISEDPTWRLAVRVEPELGPASHESLAAPQVLIDSDSNEAATTIQRDVTLTSQLVPGFKLERIHARRLERFCVVGLSRSDVWPGVHVRLTEARDARGIAWQVDGPVPDSMPWNKLGMHFYLTPPADDLGMPRFFSLKFEVFRTVPVEFLASPAVKVVEDLDVVAPRVRR